MVDASRLVPWLYHGTKKRDLRRPMVTRGEIVLRATRMAAILQRASEKWIGTRGK